MARKSRVRGRRQASSTDMSASSVDEMLLAAMARGDGSFETGRYLVTFKEGALKEGVAALGGRGLRTADAREFTSQAVNTYDVGDADSLVLPELGVALVTSAAFAERGLSVQAEIASDSPIESIDPEYFVFAKDASDYLRGFSRAVEVIGRESGSGRSCGCRTPRRKDAQVAGATFHRMRR